MATEKNINSRIQHKHDIEANWLKATNFIPKAGELIIYDVDATHTEPRLKIGNGTTSVNDLPFAGDSSKVTDTKVTQNAAITTNGEYPVILGNTTGIEEVTDTVNKTSTLKYNPSTKVLTAPTFRGGLTTNSSNIILTESTNYSTELPASGVEGQLYFLEDNSAAQNDYAEYRICNEDFIPGQVVCENGDDTLSIAIERMQPGANIISDTFGFAIGETEEAKCPIAISGRVLAYTYEPRESFKPGEAVCAGPNGTVSKMTREEIREYPERIIGTVSAIPNYDIWGAGKIKVNNRIWIKI